MKQISEIAHGKQELTAWLEYEIRISKSQYF